jgi:hypothetical protein
MEYFGVCTKSRARDLTSAVTGRRLALGVEYLSLLGGHKNKQYEKLP